MGLPSPLLASMVMDLDGGDLASSPGTAGEAVYRSPAMMSGYYRDEPATREALRVRLVPLRRQLRLRRRRPADMLDRYKDIIKTGGENVSSLRVEAVLAQHPDIDKAVVIGLPHDRWGEAVTAVVIRRAGREPSPEEIIEFCRQTVAGYEAPKDVIFTDALPETVGGKVLKYKLRAQYAGHYGTANR